MMIKMYEEIKREAYDHILPFWYKMIDLKHGGFYGEVDADLVVNKKGHKGGIATARLLWSFARAYRYQATKEIRRAMDHAYAYLIDVILDREHGGLFWMVDYKGEVIDDRKHVYAQAFGIYALSEYVLATGDQEALNNAIGLYHLIESKGFDFTNRGYLEEFTRDWCLKDNEMLSENGVTAYFTMNTYLHILEAYTNLYRVFPSSLLRDSLYRLIRTFKKKIFDEAQGMMKVFFDEKWQSLIDLNSFGHDIEATWLIDEALKVLEIEDHKIQLINEKIASNILHRSIQTDGSIINEREGNIMDFSRVWWGQAEAMVGFMNLYQSTKEDRFKVSAESMWSYIKTRLIDMRPGGEWHYGIESDGAVSRKDVVEPWKTPYHNLRACIEMLERIERIQVNKIYSVT